MGNTWWTDGEGGTSGGRVPRLGQEEDGEVHQRAREGPRIMRSRESLKHKGFREEGRRPAEVSPRGGTSTRGMQETVTCRRLSGVGGGNFGYTTSPSTEVAVQVHTRDSPSPFLGRSDSESVTRVP